MPELTKNDRLIAYIANKHGIATITSLIKLAYLIDYVSVQQNHSKISDFSYLRWHFGPFDKTIYDVRDNLLAAGVLESRSEYNQFAEYQVYVCDNEISLEGFNPEQKEIIDNLLLQAQGYGPKMLTQVAYETAPMATKGYKIDNKIGIGDVLDLTIPPSAIR